MTDKVKVSVSAEDAGVSTLLRTLSKQLSTLERDQKRVATSATTAATAQNRLASSVRGVLGNLRSLAAGYALLRVGRFVTDQLDAADAIGKLAQKTGASTEALSVLAFAGETADASLDQIAAGMRALAKSQVELQQGNKATVASFRAIGLTAADIAGLDADQAFRKIADAMGGFEDDSNKAVVAMQIFGKSGAELIPLLDDIADGGFDEAAAQAAKFGKVVSQDAAKAAAEFNDQLALMKSEASGAALSFGQEVVPALSDVFSVLTELKGEGEQTFAETLGKGAAAIVRNTARIAIFAFKSVGEELGLLGRVGVETWRAIKSAAKFDFDNASIHLDAANDAFEEMRTTAERVWKETGDALDKAEKDREAKTVDARKKREAAEKKRRIQIATKDAGDLAKAQREAEDNARESEGKVLAASLALRDQEVERSFSKGLSSLDAYFQARRQTIVEAGAQEIAALQASKKAIEDQPVSTAVEKVQRDDKSAQLAAQIRVKEIEQKRELAKLDEDREGLTLTLANAVVDAETRMAAARGNTSAEARRSLDADVEAYRVALSKIGQLTEAEQAKAVSTFRLTLTLDVDAKANQEKIDALFAEIDRKRTELDQEASLGLRSQLSAQKELVAFEAARLPTLKALADELERAATALGNPEAIAKARDLQVRLEAVGVSASESARQIAELGTNIADAAGDNLEQFLATTVTQVDSVGAAFASLATSVVADIQRIVAALLRAKIVESVTKLLLSFGGGGSLRAEDGFGFGGGTFASGGYTGPGGKYQPAGIVHKGEYVFPQEAVRRLGIRRLDEMAGLRTPNIRRPRRGYADGGLVAGAPQAFTLGGSLDINATHEGTSVHPQVWLESPDGQRTMVKVLVQNRGKVRSITR